jgi:hypothetical protein
MVMNTRILIAVAIALAFIATPTMVTADHETEDRESSYISMSRFNHGLNGPFQEFCEEQITGGEDCPAFIPSGLMTVTCDTSNGFFWLGELSVHPERLPEGFPVDEGDPVVATPFKGVGGVIFCNVLRGASITVEVDDVISPLISATVNCPFEDLEQVTVTRALDYPDPSEADPEYSGTIPDWCASTHLDAEAASPQSNCDVRIAGFGLACEPEYEYDEDDGPWNYCDPNVAEPGDSVHGQSVYCGHPNWQDNTEVTVFVNGPPLGLGALGTVTLDFD